MYSVLLGIFHALSFLLTRWSKRMQARITCLPVRQTSSSLHYHACTADLCF